MFIFSMVWALLAAHLDGGVGFAYLVAGSSEDDSGVVWEAMSMEGKMRVGKRELPMRVQWEARLMHWTWY